LLQSFKAAGVAYRQYAIDEKLGPVALPELQPDEYFLYINYLGLKEYTVQMLSARYGQQLIADCTQAFFTKGNGRSWFFNSCRKFFGVPDGAYLYPPDGIQIEPVESHNETYTLEHLIKRFNGHVQEGYTAFKENEKLCGPEITGMSVLSDHLLSNIDYTEVIARRRANFNYLHQVFKNSNRFHIAGDNESVPMMYPLLPAVSVNRESLYRNQLFIPTFWAEVKDSDNPLFETERKLAAQLLPLPIDHRYTEADMQRMAAVIKTTL
jgi:hypothetical protein